MNQLVYGPPRSEVNGDKLAVLLSRDAPRERDTVLHKHARRFVSRHLPVIPGSERDRDAPALQLARQRLGAGLFSSTFACLGDHSKVWVTSAMARLLRHKE